MLCTATMMESSSEARGRTGFGYHGFKMVHRHQLYLFCSPFVGQLWTILQSIGVDCKRPTLFAVTSWHAGLALSTPTPVCALPVFPRDLPPKSSYDFVCSAPPRNFFLFSFALPAFRGAGPGERCQLQKNRATLVAIPSIRLYLGTPLHLITSASCLSHSTSHAGLCGIVNGDLASLGTSQLFPKADTHQQVPTTAKHTSDHGRD